MDQAEQLRNAIKLRSEELQKKEARVLTITSGKGGVGKLCSVQFRNII